MKTKLYHCEIGNFTREINATSPENAAMSCAIARQKSRDWFANECPMAASVMVDGVEYEPAAYAGPESKHVYGE